MATVEELAGHFRALGSEHRSRSPFHAGLCANTADEPEIVAILHAAPEQQQLPVLLMAAVHAIVLTEPELELAGFYPTVHEQPQQGDPFPAFRALCRDRADDLRAIVSTRRVQTNEVGRSAIFLPALALIGDKTGAMSLIDVGTSAGLNLQLDRFEYHYSPGGVVGGPSPVVIHTEADGTLPVPVGLPHVADRIGIDPAPIDATDPVDARWLMACVWPDQHDRFERLRGALALARQHPTRVRRADAVGGVAAAIDEVAATGHPVVLNSWVLNYLTTDERRRYVRALDSVGADRDLTWIYAEAPALCTEIPFGDFDGDRHDTWLTATTWRHGERTTDHLATAHPHGYWLTWHRERR